MLGTHHEAAASATVADPLPAYDRSTASPNGLPSVSRHTLHRSPGWMTSPPSSLTRFSAASMSGTEKYGSDTRSPGPVPLGWRPRSEPPSWVCQPSPSPSRRPSSSTSKTPFQNRRARAGSSAGNSTSRIGDVISPRYDSRPGPRMHGGIASRLEGLITLLLEATSRARGGRHVSRC
jgi:hypothetical protein